MLVSKNDVPTHTKVWGLLQALVSSKCQEQYSLFLNTLKNLENS